MALLPQSCCQTTAYNQLQQMLSSPISVGMSQMLPRYSFATKRLLEPAACGSRHDPCLTLQYVSKAWASMTLAVAPVSMSSNGHTGWQTCLTQICYKGLQQAAPHTLWFSKFSKFCLWLQSPYTALAHCI